MPDFVLSARSLSRLEGVHPDLVRVVKHAITITDADFGVLEGVRTLDREKELLAAKASTTLNSRHLVGSDGYGHAIDLAAYIGGIYTKAIPPYRLIMQAMKLAAQYEDVPLRCGGDWLSFRDWGHFELPEKQYPNSGVAT